MRKELEIIEKIEKYLKGKLNASEKEVFEKRLAADAELREEVKLQEEVMRGINRASLKQKAKKAYRKYKLTKSFIKWGLTGLTIITVSSAILYYTKYAEYSFNNIPYELNEMGKNEWADADKYLPSQKFNLTAAKDTVIETDAGIVMVIPANCFLDDDGRPEDGEIELEIKEALDAASIIKAGLSTKSNDRLLESGGMFYVNARKNGKSLKINPVNGIYAEVPTDNKRGDMKLFEGQRTAQGSINWINPRPLENFLIPADIKSLNFYPPLYLDSLQKWGYNVKNKKFTDSLYYSFASLFANSHRLESGNIVVHDITAFLDLFEEVAHGYYREKLHGINPAKIKAIWNDQFQNTLISTREFEERISYIHKSCNNRILDLYINNLDKNISQIDSMAAEISGALRNDFLSFASRNEGKAKINSGIMNKLRDYYQLKAKAITEAAAKTEKDYLDKQAKIEQIANDKKTQHQREDLLREKRNLQKEYDINLTDACRQLGIKKPKIITKQVYGTTITFSGWKNIDAYVMEATVNRTTLNFTSDDGKKAVIKYLPVSIQIRDYMNYDRIYVYLLSDKLNSFMRLNQNKGVFDEKLNELMTYKMFCLGYKEDNIFFASLDEVHSKTYDAIALRQIDKNSLDKKLNSLGKMNQIIGMKKELSYWQSELIETKRKRAEFDRMQFRSMIIDVILPCYNFVENSVFTRTAH